MNSLNRILEGRKIGTWLIRLAQCWLVLIISAAYGPNAWATREISIYVPPFEGPVELSRSVNTILRLQIWQTLRKTAEAGGETLHFGAGAVKWGPDHLPELSHRSAETVAHHGRILSQIVLWGTVQEYGRGAIVQAFLSLPDYPKLNERYYEDFRTERHEVWIIRIPAGGKVVAFSTDVPRRRLSFEPVILKQQVIAHYSTLDSIVMYELKNPKKKIGVVRDIIDGVEQSGDKAVVTSRGLTGIVYLPELSEHRSEIVDFASGLVRIFRADWHGAIALLKDVTENSRAPTDIRIDANLYLAMANAKIGRSGAEYIDQARKLNPYAMRIVRFLIMDKLAELSRAIDASAPPVHQREILKAIRQLIEKHKDHFLANDPWFIDLKKGVSQLKDRQ